jgi:hypothetical protein
VTLSPSSPQSNPPQHPDLALTDALIDFRDDPLGFIYFAWPWREKGGPLEDEDGPDQNQRAFLRDLGQQVSERGFDGSTPVMPVRMAEASGHGTGKTVLGAWLACWILATRPHSIGTVTAGTKTQLKTRTWAGIREWLRTSNVGHWFEIGAEQIYRKGFPDTWKLTAQTCKAENAQAFAGQHARKSTSWYLFDEASRVPDEIWRVAYGGLTDGEPMIFAWGQPERREGEFYDVTFGKQKDRWVQHSVDSRNSRFTNKALIAEWIEDYGIDSDYVRVRVLGKAPLAAAGQFIDAGRIMEAQRRKPSYMQDDPLIVGLDVSRGGAANTVFRFRRGLDAATIAPVRLTGEQARDSMRVAAIAAKILNTTYAGIRPTAMFVDSGFGGPIVDRLRQLGHLNVFEISFGSNAPDIKHFANMRTYMWSQMRDWLIRGAIPNEQSGATPCRLETDLQSPWFHHNKKDQLALESKEDMQKRGIASPDDGDALALTFAQHVAPLSQQDDDDQEEEFSGGWSSGTPGGWMR